jgi:hypothetical protein
MIPPAPIPAERDDEFRRRYTLLSGAISFVEVAVPGIPASKSSLGTPSAEVSVHRDVYSAHAARVVMALLLEEGQKTDALQDDLRKAIATLALPDERNSRSSLVTASCWRTVSNAASPRSITSGALRTQQTPVPEGPRRAPTACNYA